MTPRQIDLLKDSFALIVPRRAEVSELFYARLFELAPQVRPMFKADLEGATLMQVLTDVVRSLGNLARVQELVDELARRHVRYGVRSAHSASVARALILAFRETLGETFTIEVEEAWVDTYTLLSSRRASAEEEMALAA